MILYVLEGSGNSYKARLMLEFLGLAYEKREPAVHPADEEFLRLNPLGQVPVLIDKSDTGTSSLPLPDGRVLRDSNAILVYLALKYDPSSSWYPVADPVTASRIAQWMSYATHEVTDSLLWVRIKNKFSWEIPVTYDEALDRSRKVLCFPYVAFAETSSSGALLLANYPAVVAWVERLKALPNFSPMPPF